MLCGEFYGWVGLGVERRTLQLLAAAQVRLSGGVLTDP